MKEVHTIDYEYNRKDNEFLHLVCVSIDDEVYWLNDDSDTVKALSRLKEIEDYKARNNASDLGSSVMAKYIGLNENKGSEGHRKLK